MFLGQSKYYKNVDYIFFEPIYILIAPFIDIPMFNVKYLAVHKVQMHAGTVRKLLYVVCLYVR